MSKKGRIYYRDLVAGILVEDEQGFSFTYDKLYLKNPEAKPISLAMKLQEEEFRSKTIFPFFDGLIPEGWLLNIAEKNWKMDPRDRMELLLTFCRDAVGAVGIERLGDDDE